VGSIESRKGQDILLNALATLAPQDRQRFECVFIGRMIDWAEPEFCRQVTQHAKALGNVHFLGVLPANQVGAYLSAGDIFVLPSRDEVLPLSLIQAMALARPVIATRVGGIAEIIEDGVNGLLVDSEDSQALASALISLTNPDFRRALGHKAQLDYQHRLTNQHFLEEMMNLIESMIKLHNSQF
jgi:glycosyltransferase involved in cell wall biosynthesis